MYMWCGGFHRAGVYVLSCPLLSSLLYTEGKHGKKTHEHRGTKWGVWKHQPAQQRTGTHDTKQEAAMTVHTTYQWPAGGERERETFEVLYYHKIQKK